MPDESKNAPGKHSDPVPQRAGFRRPARPRKSYESAYPQERNFGPGRQGTYQGGGGWVKSSSNRKSRSCRALDRRQSFLSGLRRLAQAQSLKAQRPSDGRKNRATNRDPLANHGAVP